MAILTVLHTSDLHNRLTAAGAGLIARHRRSLPGSLLVDAGDAVGAGNLYYRPGGEPILTLMAQAGYQAMCMGNRESHPSRAVLIRKLGGISFPVLAANIRPKRKPLPDFVKDWIMLEVDAIRVALFGLAPQITSPESWWSRVTDYVFDDPIRTAAGLAPKLRAQADLVICLSHLGLAADRELARAGAIGLIVGGHSHRALAQPEPVGECWIVQAGSHARYLGRVDLELAEGRVVEARGELVPLQGKSRG